MGTLANGEFGFAARLRETKIIEQSTGEAIHRHTSQKLSTALQYATSTTGWYRERCAEYDKSNEPWSFLNNMQPICKQDLQRHAAEFRSKAYSGRVLRKTTGGSTGQPITILKDPVAVSFERAASWSFYESYGLSLGAKCIRFWGSPTSTARSIRSFLADIATNRTTLSAFGVNDEQLEEHWLRCRTVQAPFWYGYASMLAIFAEYVRHTGKDGRSLGVRVIVTTSEVLTDSTRRLLEDVFGAMVRNEYGCGEFGPIAYECEEGLMHITYNNICCEIITSAGQKAQPGESGKILVTDLNNRVMPLIRFEVGDMAEAGPTCVCGRQSPTIKHIWGREYDFIVGADGRKYHGEFIMYLIEDLAQRGVTLNQFQVIQNSDNSIEVRIVDVDTAGESILEIVCREVRDRLPGTTVSGKIVSSIERRPSGKTPLIIRLQ